MMRAAVILMLLVTLAVPAGAATTTTALPYTLTFTSDGKVSGTFGGVPVLGTYTGSSTAGTFTLTVDGKTFASGTYSCTASGCTYTLDHVLGAAKTATFTSAGLVGVTSGSLSGLYATHGAWVSGVAHWANTNLTGVRVGQVVSAAARSKGKSAAGGSASAERSGKQKKDSKKP